MFKNTNILLYPSKNDAFPLTLLESLSYGVPVVATNEGSISYILDDTSGIVIKSLNDLSNAFDKSIKKFIDIETAKYCRKMYLNNFSLEQFEENLLRIFR